MSHKRALLLGSILSFTFLSSAATEAARAEPMTEAEIMSTVVSNTLHGNHRHHQWWMLVVTDGTIRGKLSSGERDQGVWRLSDDGIFCAKWQRWWDRVEICRELFRKGKKLKMTVKSGPSENYTASLLSGNPEEL